MSAALLSELVLPPSVAARLWRGSDLERRLDAVLSSGHRVLDKELPGGGWPRGSLTEVLLPAGLHAEWRLLAPALARVQQQGGTVFLVGGPHVPHLPGLRQAGIDERLLVWVRPGDAREGLWAVQQILRSGQAGALLAWLPDADVRALRRLQACALDSEAPAFVMRPAGVRSDSSPAPLRVELAAGPTPWSLRLQVLKRRGPALEQALELFSAPAGLAPVLAAQAVLALAEAQAAEAKTQADETRTAQPAGEFQPLSFEAADLVAAQGRAAVVEAISLHASLPSPSHATPLHASPAPHADSANGELFEEPSHEPLAGPVLPCRLRAVAG